MEHRAGRDPAAQLHPHVPVPDAGRRSPTTPATTTRRSTRRCRWPTSRASPARKARVGRSAASCAASATRRYIEACGIAPSNIAGALGARAGLFEAGEVRVHPTGSVTVFTGSHSHGQGHETTFAQVVAARLGIPVDNVEVVHGDTGRIPFGMGTYGSRSLAVGGTAIVKAVDKIVAKGKKIAAHLLEAADADIEFEDGEFKVAGTDRRRPFGEVALTAYVPHNYPLDKLEPGPERERVLRSDQLHLSRPARYICEVEVDPDTGEVEDRRVHRGRRLRQHHQPDDRRGPGARRPRAGHRPGDDREAASTTARPASSLTGSYMDYAMPRADDMPSFKVGDRRHAVHAQPARRQGLRRGRRDRRAAGADQRGARRAAPLGVTHLDMPATPERVWRAHRRPRQRLRRTTHVRIRLPAADSRVADARAAARRRHGGKPSPAGRA